MNFGCCCYDFGMFSDDFRMFWGYCLDVFWMNMGCFGDVFGMVALSKFFELLLKSSKEVIKKHFKIIRQLFKVIKQHFRIINKTLQNHLYQFQSFIKVRSVNFFENDSCESKDVNF